MVKKRISQKPSARSKKSSTQKVSKKQTKSAVEERNWRERTKAIFRTVKEKFADDNYASFSMSKKHHKPHVPELEKPVPFLGVVWKTLWTYKFLWLIFIVFTVVVSFLMVGFTQQSNYQQVNKTIGDVKDSLKGTVFEQIPNGVLVVTSTLSGALGSNMNESQQILDSYFYFFMGLVVVWLLRQLLAGNKVRFRDGLYNAGAPVIPMVVLTFILMLQILPVALLLMAFNTALSMQILEGGVEMAAFSLAVVFALLLTLYFVTTTVFAYMISTVPGIYPVQAYGSARQLIAGQRLRMLGRLLLLALVITLAWLLVTAGAVALAGLINQPTWPIVPIIIQVLTAMSLLYGVAYCYMLYRRMIREPDVKK